MPTTKFCQGISDISDTYMGFIIDQWGVLHDGNKPFDGVVECLQDLKSRGKTIIILSNSGMAAEQAKAELKKIGIAPTLYDHVVTSGELIHKSLENQDTGLLKGYGRKCYVFGKKEAEGVFDGTGIEIVRDISEADFMLIAGMDKKVTSVDEHTPILKEAVRRGVKAICTNPDSRALMGANYLMGPGLIARTFQDFGGIVKYIGKPHGPIFKYCIELLQGHDVYPAQAVMIGDTMAHDIMGAHYMHIDTCLVKTGMHAGVFKNCKTPADVDRTLDILITHYNHVRPRYLVDQLIWGKALPDRKHKIHKKHVRNKAVEPVEEREKIDKSSAKPQIRKKPTPRMVKE